MNAKLIEETLVIAVPEGTKVGRVLVLEGEHYCTFYYPEEDEDE